MDNNGLPKSAEKTLAEIELYTGIRDLCETIRLGTRLDLAEVAIQEYLRCDARLKLLKRHLKRFKNQPAEVEG